MQIKKYPNEKCEKYTRIKKSEWKVYKLLKVYYWKNGFKTNYTNKKYTNGKDTNDKYGNEKSKRMKSFRMKSIRMKSIKIKSRRMKEKNTNEKIQMESIRMKSIWTGNSIEWKTAFKYLFNKTKWTVQPTK